MAGDIFDVAIVGGGVIGCALASELALRGASTVLVERDRIASGASYGAAGIVGTQTDAESDSPMFRLALRSREVLDELADRLGNPFEYERCGAVRVTDHPDQAEAFRRRVAWQCPAGLEARLLDADEVRDLVPGLASAPLQAMWTPDGQLSPARLTAALAHDAACHGANVRQGCPATAVSAQSVETPAGRIAAAAVVVACGAWSGALLPVPVAPVKGQRVLLRMPGHSVRHVLFNGRCYVVPKAGGHVLVGGTHEPEAGYDQRPTLGGMAWLVDAALGMLPELRQAEVVEHWAGLRPGTPDGLPVLGRLGDGAGPWLATGHLARGVMLAPGTARILADAILDGAPLPPAFLPGRVGIAPAV